MEKIRLEICCGTTCYMLGGDKLLKLDELKGEEWKDKVEISACPCMEECVSDKLCSAPVVRIDGKLYGRATVESVTETIEGLLAGKAEA